MLPDLTFEQKNLYLRYEVLRKEYADLLAQRDEMLTYEKPYLNALYMSVVGQKLHQKYVLQLEIKMVFSEIQLKQAYINRNIAPDTELINKQLDKQFAAYQQKLAQEQAQLDNAKKYLDDTLFLAPHIALKIKEVYKTIVKKLHPDINPNCTEYEKDLLLKAQVCYEMSDLNGLNDVLLQMNLETPAEKISVAGMKEIVEKLEEQVAMLKQNIFGLEQSFPFNYREKLSDGEWIEREQAGIDDDIEKLHIEKKKYTEYLLLMDEWKPQLLN